MCYGTMVMGQECALLITTVDTYRLFSFSLALSCGSIVQVATSWFSSNDATIVRHECHLQNIFECHIFGETLIAINNIGRS